MAWNPIDMLRGWAFRRCLRRHRATHQRWHHAPTLYDPVERGGWRPRAR